MAAKSTTNGRDVTAELAYLTRALKAPTLREVIERLADRARTETWRYEKFLAACLQRERGSGSCWQLIRGCLRR